MELLAKGHADFGAKGREVEIPTPGMPCCARFTAPCVLRRQTNSGEHTTPPDAPGASTRGFRGSAVADTSGFRVRGLVDHQIEQDAKVLRRVGSSRGNDATGRMRRST